MDNSAPFRRGFFYCRRPLYRYISVMATVILVSKCLLGARCRWDGKALEKSKLFMLNGRRAAAICPEMAGGLPCPRQAAWITEGDGFDVLDGKSKVVDIDGNNVTDNYLKGAQAALNLAYREGAEIAYLKENSPSCGVKYIKKDGEKVPGSGVAAALLKRHGFRLESA